MTGTVRFLHLLGAMVWVGGLITLGALIPALRKAGADRPILQAVARQFDVCRGWPSLLQC